MDDRNGMTDDPTWTPGDYHMARPRAIVIRAPGTNCDEETADAWQRAGATVETWHVNRLIECTGASSIVSRS